MSQIDHFLRTVDFLPPAATILPRLLPLLSNPDSASGRIVELIRIDPALTAQVLQASNNAAVAPARRTSDLMQAVTILGFREVYRLVAIVSGLAMLRVSKPSQGVNSEALWRHSVITGLASQVIAKRYGEDESAAFTSGLLHDLGKVLLSEKLKEDYAKLVAEAALQRTAIVDFEQERLGFHHAELGGQLLAQWQFDPSVIAAVRDHHKPEPSSSHAELTAIVCLGNNLSYQLEGKEHFVPTGSREAALSILCIPPSDLLSLLAETRGRFSEIEGFLQDI